MSAWTEENIQAVLSGLAGELGVKLRDFMSPFFIAIAGSKSSTPVMNSMYLIGADMTLQRLRHAIEVLGGVSKKKMKELEKRNASFGGFLNQA